MLLARTALYAPRLQPLLHCALLGASRLTHVFAGVSKSGVRARPRRFSIHGFWLWPSRHIRVPSFGRFNEMTYLVGRRPTLPSRDLGCSTLLSLTAGAPASRRPFSVDRAVRADKANETTLLNRRRRIRNLAIRVIPRSPLSMRKP